MKLKVIFFFLFACFLSSCEKNNENKYGTLIEVPDEISTVQEAVNISEPFDTILIKSGEYYENDIVIKKPVFITSEFVFTSDSNMIKNTIINADNKFRVFTISNISDTLTMNGITIKNGHANPKYPEPSDDELNDCNGGGIFCYMANLKLQNMFIIENSAYEPNSRGIGGGLYIDSSSVILANVQINDNYSLRSGAAFSCNHSILNIFNSKIQNNHNSGIVMGSAIEIMNSTLNFIDVIFSDNISDSGSIWDFFIADCEGRFENVSISNDTTIIRDSLLDLINCSIPGY
jgi:hypothetical protein